MSDPTEPEITEGGRSEPEHADAERSAAERGGGDHRESEQSEPASAGVAQSAAAATDTEVEQDDAISRRQVFMLLGLVGVLSAIGVAFFFWSQARVSGDLAERNQQAQEALNDFQSSRPVTPTAAPPPTTPTAVPEVQPGLHAKPGEVLVVNRVPGEDYGRLAIRHADGTRTLLDRRCMRVHIAADHGVCLSDETGIVPAFETTFFPSINPEVSIKSYASALPSRARISPGGTFSTVTAFVSGSSYADIGVSSSTLLTFDEIDSQKLLDSGSQFQVKSDEPRFRGELAQYWGATFAPNENDIYVTGFYGEQPEIMKGTIDDMMLEPTGWVGSCPSLSPDGKTLVFKEMRENGEFDLVAIDLESGDKWTLNETRSADDQVEWLDNDTILYALHPEGTDGALQPQFDIWSLDITEGATPELFLPFADSPAVAR